MENEVQTYNDPDENLDDDLLPEYHFDYSKSKPNPYAARALCRKVTSLEADSLRRVPSTSKRLHQRMPRQDE